MRPGFFLPEPVCSTILFSAHSPARLQMSGLSFFLRCLPSVSDLPSPTPHDDVPSPCMKQCQVIHRRLVMGQPMPPLCASCGRTVDEITAWRDMTPERKRTCVQAAQTRRAWLRVRAT